MDKELMYSQNVNDKNSSFNTNLEGFNIKHL